VHARARKLLPGQPCLNTTSVKKCFSGPGQGQEKDILIIESIKDVLAKLKEPVTVKLTTFPRLGETTFRNLCSARPDLEFVRVEGQMAECLVPLMDGAEKFAFDVLAQRREFGLIGVALDCMDISEEWITFEDINRENNVSPATEVCLLPRLKNNSN